ncbi:DUF362 domain-containing protein [Candidatus Woesearchaeota archaeon]|nr:DUF362 domain-containing protein [Candidatus Woesearchaeota archaeon]
MADIYFVPARTDNSLLDDLERLYSKALKGVVKKNDFTAIKMTFGERGNTAFIRPIFARRVVDCVRNEGAKPFLVDCNTLYKHKRHNTVDHLETALMNGFSYATVNAPLIIADGIQGTVSEDVEINLPLVKTAKIGPDIMKADSIIALSHFKGHMVSGFGGAIKNIGMGSASRAGKQQQHSSTKPDVDAKNCVVCRKCGSVCPADAISYNPKANIDKDKCVGCEECVAACPTGAIGMRWDSSHVDMQKKMAEYCYAVAHKRRIGYINVLLNITPDCDCFPKSDKAIVPDIGILAGLDPVAIDQASLDLVNRELGLENTRLKNKESQDKFKDIHGFDSTIQLTHGEEIGLGETKYKLIKI